jgi:hypothetical protein
MFQLEKTQQATCTNANPRTELHGEERVRAIDLSFCITGENTLLDLIQPGLREHHYCNNALKEGQEVLPGMLIPLPDLRFPRLPLSYHFAKGEKWRGYRWIWDWGTEGEHADFTDVVLSNVHYEILQGGSCKVFFTIQYNGGELSDNDVYGELAGLASMGEIYFQLIAPPELLPAKKGYRAGQPDTPPPAADNGTGNLLDNEGGTEGGDDSDDDGPPAGSAEAAFIAEAKGNGTWPFPNNAGGSDQQRAGAQE